MSELTMAALKLRLSETEENIQLLNKQAEHYRFVLKEFTEPRIPRAPKRKAVVTGVDGTVTVLQREREWMSHRDLYAALVDMGYKSKSAHPVQTLQNTLNGEIYGAKKTERQSRIVKHEESSLYGLPEWKIHDDAETEADQELETPEKQYDKQN